MTTQLENAIKENNKSLEQWKTSAIIHTIAFVIFLFISLSLNSLWILASLGLTIWNGFKASSCWNNVAILKALNQGNDETLKELQRINDFWYNADGTMKQERIDEALERLNKENKKND